MNGYLTKILFKDGAAVKKGDPLYEIDPRPYKATLEKAEGDLASARALARRAEADLARAKMLRSRGSDAITQGEYDKAVADKDTADAGVKSAQAAVDAAALNLEFTTVRSEVTGRVSRTLITVGQLRPARGHGPDPGHDRGPDLRLLGRGRADEPVVPRPDFQAARPSRTPGWTGRCGAGSSW